MASRYSTFSYDDEVNLILEEMKKRNFRISAVIRDLLRVFRDNDYKIPAIKSETELEAEEMRKELKAEREEGE